MTYDLSSLGWGADLEAAYRPLDRCDAVPARVLRVELGVCTVIGTDGVARASLAGTVLVRAAGDLARLPCVGDWVAVRRWPDRRTTVEAVLPRRSVLTGRPAGRVLAANLDAVAVVERLRGVPGPGRVADLLAVAEACGVRPVIVLADSTGLPAGARAAAVHRFTGAFPGVPVLPLGGGGLDELRTLVAPGRTLALLGADDAGLVQALAGASVLPGRGDPDRPADGRSLVPVPAGGAVLDLTGAAEVQRSFRPSAPAHAEDRASTASAVRPVARSAVRLSAVTGSRPGRSRPRR